MKKEVYVLIGPAAIGKTTYLKSVGFPESKLKIVSRDDIVLQMCKKYKLTHDELYLFPPHDSKIGDRIPGFEKYGIVVESPELIKHLHPFSYDYLNKINIEIYNSFYERFESAVKDPAIDYVALDRVHMRKEERVIYYPYLENRKDFFVTYVLFNFKDSDTVDVISKASEIRKQKMLESVGYFRTVSKQVQENMIKFYEEPGEDEGYDSIIQVDTLPKLREFIEENAAKLNETF
jgi:hypothetical protein